MPGEDIHRAATLTLAGVTFVAAAGFVSSDREQLLSIIGVLTGVLVTPDMDLAENFSGEPLWYLYGRLFKHRGVSHWPVIGTLTRVVYLALFAVPVIVAWGRWDWLVYQISGKWFYVWLIGLTAADVLHGALDITVSRIKKECKQLKRF